MPSLRQKTGVLQPAKFDLGFACLRKSFVQGIKSWLVVSSISSEMSSRLGWLGTNSH